MTSQIRVDEITNRSGLGTVTIYDNGFEFTGVTTFTENVDIEGNLTIGGVLTYEDTTNIDSVGVITARGGIRVTGDSIHVESSEDRLLYLKSTDANAYLTFEDTDSSSGFANRVGTVSDGLYFSTGGGGERLRISSGGYAGINEGNPTQQLHVHDDTNYQGILINGNAAPRITFAKANSTTVEWGVGIDGTNGNNFAIAQAGNTPKFIIDANGKIGIGDNTPDNTLSIKGLGSFDADSNSFYFGSNFTGTGQNYIGSSKHAQRFFLNNASANGYFSYSNTGTTGTAGNAITWQERFRIHSTGVPQFTTTGTQYVSATVPAFVVNSNGDHALVLNNQNTTDPRGLFIYQDQDVNNGTSYFLRARAGGTDRAHLYSNGTLQLHSGNLKLASGNGIDFSAAGNASGMSSELLDDYEEGTFTPNDASGAGLTFVEAAGIYTKVGRMVHVQVRVKYPSTSNTSYVSIGGFPFSATNQGTNISNGANASGFGYFTGSNLPQIHMSASGTHTNFYYLSTIQRNNNLSGLELRFGVVYSTS